MTEVLEFAKSVPEAMWAAIIATVLAYGGVIFTIFHNSRQQRRQHAHELERASLDRIHDMRREIYLGMASEIPPALQALGDLHDRDLGSIGAAGFMQGYFPITAQASLVASDETAKLIQVFTAEFTIGLFRLLGEALPLQDVKMERDLEDNAYTTAVAESQRVIATMNALREANQLDEARFNALSTSLQQANAEARRAGEARGQHWDRLNELIRDQVVVAVEEVGRISKYASEVRIALRNELGLTTDIELARKSTEVNDARVLAAMDELLQNMADREEEDEGDSK